METLSSFLEMRNLKGKKLYSEPASPLMASVIKAHADYPEVLRSFLQNVLSNPTILLLLLEAPILGGSIATTE